MDWEYYLWSAGGFLIGAIISLILYAFIAKMKGTDAEQTAKRIINDANKESEHILKEAKLTAKSESIKIKEDINEEVKQRRKEQLAIEKRLLQREESLEKKSEQYDQRLRQIEKKDDEADQIKERLQQKEIELKDAIHHQVKELEKISGMDKETAKNILLEKISGEVSGETGIMVRNLVDEAKQKAEREAQRILTYAIQRYASDCTYERTTCAIPLPSDEMKGRIIGREGRNIRALEAATGVSILIDDIPETVVISCFDPVRKEIARQIMERLIADGRIHPGRIEELVKKVKKEVEDTIYDAGESAVLEIGLQGLPAPLIKILGRLKYRYSFSQNVLRHSIETAAFMGMIAAELGLDQQKAKRIGLLHDLGKAVDHEVEGSHAQIGAELLRKHGESKEIVNAVAAHHEEEEPQSLYAILIVACDALSASRPGARSESSELYLKRLEQLETIARSFSGVEQCFALQAGREIRVVIEPEKIDEGSAQILARNICSQIEQQVTYPGQIKVTIIRETRSVDYAK